MNYSTFNDNNFFIKKNSTYPDLKYHLIQKIRDEFNLSDELLENVAVTFSMIDANTGRFIIANTPADLVINRDRAKYPTETEYTLEYHFKESETKRVGRYLGEFVVDFLNPAIDCGKIKLPLNSEINIIITDTITKTTVI